MGQSSGLSLLSTRRGWLVTLAVIVVLALGVASVVSGRSVEHAEAKSTATAEEAVPVTVAVVEPRLATVWDEFSGRLEAIDRVEVRPRVSGAIQSAKFVEGALVKAGDVLFAIDPEPYEAEVERAEAQLAAAKARATFAQGELERAQQLIGKNVVTQRDLEQRDNANREAIANVRAAEASLRTAQLNLEYTQVRAPVNGRVGRIEVTAGNLVAAGPTSPVLTSLVSVSPIYATFDASEDIVLHALAAIAAPDGKRGALTSIPIEMTTGEGTRTTGHVQFVDNRVNVQTGTMRVRAVFPNDAGQLVPGQFARVRMGQPKEQRLLLVDEKAIGTDQDKRYVLVVDRDSRATYRAITLGGTVSGQRVVASGLNPGDSIVINGMQRVRPGALVKTQVAQMGDRTTSQTARSE